MADTVLIVDDSVSVRAMLGRALREAGHEVVEARDGPSALVALGQRRPDLVITDVNMGEMDGLTLVARIREQHPKMSLPILVLTTESGDELRARGRAVGASGWLVKPFEPTQLRAVVSHVLAKRSA